MSSFGLIIESAASIVKKLIKVLKDEVNRLLFGRAPKIEIDIRKLIEDAIKRQPEYRSLLGGKLQSELGVPHTQPRLDKIIQLIIDSIQIKVTKLKETGGQLVGGIEIIFDKTLLTELLDLSESRYVTDKGVVIEWLKWLLIEGDKLIVRQYMIGIDPKNYARTGLGQIMIPSGRTNKSWSVPVEYRGTANNNFITRALLEIQSEIDKVLEGSLR
jgi:hypothetical protein